MSGIMDQLSGNNWGGWEQPEPEPHPVEPVPADVPPSEPVGPEPVVESQPVTDVERPAGVMDAAVLSDIDPLPDGPEPDDLAEPEPTPQDMTPIAAEQGSVEPEPEPAYDWTPDSYSGGASILAQLAANADASEPQDASTHTEDTSVIQPLPDGPASAVETLSERLEASDDFDDVLSGRQPINDPARHRSMRIPLTITAVTLAVALVGGVAAWGVPRLMERHAMAECAAAREAAESSVTTLKTNRKNAKGYAKLNVKDQNLIAKLNKQLKQSIPAVADCPAADTDAIGKATQTNLDVQSKADTMSNRLAATTKRITASQDEKTLQDALDALQDAIDKGDRTLKAASVLNDSNDIEILKTKLDHARTIIKGGDAAKASKATSSLSDATGKVEQAIQKKKDADAKAKAEEEAKRKAEEEEKARQEQQAEAERQAMTQQTPATPQYVRPQQQYVRPQQQYVAPKTQTQQPAAPAPAPSPTPSPAPADPGNNGVIM